MFLALPQRAVLVLRDSDAADWNAVDGEAGEVLALEDGLVTLRTSSGELNSYPLWRVARIEWLT